MTCPQTHLDILLSRIVTHGDNPFFKSVHRNPSSPGGLTWDTTTYGQFGRDVESLATHLKLSFQRDEIPDNAVIAIKSVSESRCGRVFADHFDSLNGLTYSDIVHIYAVSRAGYVPNLLSNALTDPGVIYELLTRTQSKAFIHEPTFDLGSCLSIPEYHRIDLSTLTPTSSEGILPQAQNYDPNAIAFIQYTSGSTADLPSVIRCTNKWFNYVYDSWNTFWNAPRDGEPPDVLNIPGPVCNPSGLHGEDSQLAPLTIDLLITVS